MADRGAATRRRHRMSCDLAIGYYKWRPTWRDVHRVVFKPVGRVCTCGASQETTPKGGPKHAR